MLLSELTAYLDREFSYPVALDTVLEDAGALEIEGPNTTDSQTLASILEPLGADSFESGDALFDTIYGNLSDDFIGRKFYDDRGGNQTAPSASPMDDRDQSF